MSKTNFVDGTYLTPTFMDSLYVGQGHQHDGVDADGHASKIDATTQIIGQLPLANLAQTNFYQDVGLVAGNISLTGASATPVNILSRYSKMGSAVHLEVSFQINAGGGLGQLSQVHITLPGTVAPIARYYGVTKPGFSVVNTDYNGSGIKMCPASFSSASVLDVYSTNSIGTGFAVDITTTDTKVVTATMSVAGTGYVAGDVVSIVKTGITESCFLLITTVIQGGMVYNFAGPATIWPGLGYSNASNLTTAQSGYPFLQDLGGRTRFWISINYQGT